MFRLIFAASHRATYAPEAFRPMIVKFAISDFVFPYELPNFFGRPVDDRIDYSLRLCRADVNQFLIGIVRVKAFAFALRRVAELEP